jgi:hypothetical protein
MHIAAVMFVACTTSRLVYPCRGCFRERRQGLSFDIDNADFVRWRECLCRLVRACVT